MMVAMAAMATVHYSAYITSANSTITVKNIISGVFVEPNSSIEIYSPTIFTNKHIATVNITLNDPDNKVNNTINYTVVFESPLLKIGAMRTMAIIVYKDNGDHILDTDTDEPIGVMSPLTPFLIYKASYSESSKNELSGGKNVTYFLVASGVALEPGTWTKEETKVGIQVSVRLDSVK